MEDKYVVDYDILKTPIRSMSFQQGNTNVSKIIFTIYESGVPADITGESIEFRFIKPDKTISYLDLDNGVTITDITNGIVVCELTNDILSTPGIVRCEIVREKEDQQLFTLVFSFFVKSSIGGNGELSENYISEMETYITQWDEYVNSLEGEPGETGEQGIQGIQGEPGEDGEIVFNGSVGKIGGVTEINSPEILKVRAPLRIDAGSIFNMGNVPNDDDYNIEMASIDNLSRGELTLRADWRINLFGEIDADGNQIHRVGDPTNNSDAANKQYVDENSGDTSGGGLHNLYLNGATKPASITTGHDNFVSGVSALANVVTGHNNIANGAQALYANTTGYNNIANGFQALRANTTGYNNIANGFQALRANTTGSSNIANGYQALRANTTGSSNIANGYQALYANTTGYNNIANGFQALRANTTGNYNIANGYQAGEYTSTGVLEITNNSIFIGKDTKALADNSLNEVVIGADAVGHGDNTVTLGNSAIESAYVGDKKISTEGNSVATSVAKFDQNDFDEFLTIVAPTLVSNHVYLAVLDLPDIKGQVTFLGSNNYQFTFTYFLPDNTVKHVEFSKNTVTGKFELQTDDATVYPEVLLSIYKI